MNSFFSLEAAKSGLFANMAGMDVTGQNISNANTEGYTRQRVVLNSVGPVEPGGNPVNSVGLGVKVETIKSVKDDFLEDEIRNQSATSGYWDQKEQIVGRMESLLMEPSDDGVRKLMDDFWKSAEDLSNYPDDPSYRSAFVQSGVSLTNGTKYIEDQLLYLKDNVNDMIEQKVNTINSNLESIADINGQLLKNESDGVKLNELRNKKDKLIKDISKMINITVLDGDKLDDGRIVLDGHSLVDGQDFTKIDFSTGNSDSPYPRLKLANDTKEFTTDVNVVNGVVKQDAIDGDYKVKVEQLATKTTVENEGIVNIIKPNDYLSNIKGMKSGSFFINGKEITVDANYTSLNELANVINMAEAGVNAKVTDGGRFIITSDKTGPGNMIKMSDGTGNVLQKLGLVADVTGNASPSITDENASLNIGGSFTINGKRITIQQGVTDSLARIADEINAGVPEIHAEVITDENQLKQLKITNKDDNFSTLTLDDEDTSNILHRLGMVDAPFVKQTFKGPKVTKGQEAIYQINGSQYRSDSNTVDDAIKGVTLHLKGVGDSELHVNNIAEDGEIKALLDSRDNLIPEYQNRLYNYMKTLTDEINSVHYSGFNSRGGTHINFFEPMADSLGNNENEDALLNLKVNDKLINDSTLVATSGYDKDFFAETGVLRSAGSGDNSNVLKMADVRFKPLFEDGGTLIDNYSSMFSDLGIESQSTQATNYTQSQIMLNLTNRKEQVSGVSLDEEMTNLIKYQQGYNASARMISTINDMLDVLINQLLR